MLSNNTKLIDVIGATGHQGGAAVRALQASGQFHRSDEHQNHVIRLSDSAV